MRETFNPYFFTSETFSFDGKKWDIKESKRILNRAERAVTEVVIGKYARVLKTVSVRKRKALGAEFDLRVPIIIAAIKHRGREKLLPIDGWHRIYKAWKLGIKALPACVMTRGESDRALVAKKGSEA